MGTYTKNKRALGSTKEKLAGSYLEEHGYQVVMYNYRCRSGEIDLIAKDGEYLVFCEVKYRTDERSGHPLEAVDYKKQRVISKCAMYYITQNGLADLPCRFDVVGILGGQIELIKNAFEYCG